VEQKPTGVNANGMCCSFTINVSLRNK